MSFGITGAVIGGVGLVSSAYGQHKQRKTAKKQAEAQEKQIKEQMLIEKRKEGEADSEINRRKLLRQGGGRSLLMSAPQGSQTLGG